LTSGESTDHDKTSTETEEKTTRTEFTSEGDETRSDGTSSTLLLVDLGEKSISWLRDDGSGETGNET